MRTRILNKSGATRFFGYIPPHGAWIADGASVVVDGDLRTVLAGGRGRFSRSLELAAFTTDEDSGAITVTSMPEPSREEGRLFSWGANWSGELGDGTTVPKSSPVQVGSLSTWVEVAGGEWFSMAINGDGELFTWGCDYDYELGDGAWQNRSSPGQIGTRADWTVIAGGREAAFGVASGQLFAWGWNQAGVLGDGTETPRSVPTRIGSGAAWTSISVYQHAIGIAAGKLYAWGYNYSGQVGNGGTANVSTPAQIGSDSWLAAAAGGYHSLAITEDGRLFAWGDNFYGPLGIGTYGDAYSSPVQVGARTDWAALAAGDSMSYGLTTDGDLFAWGINYYGEVGDGTLIPKSSPVQIGAGKTWVAVASGMYGTAAAITADGELYTWGGGGNGQLGDGTTDNKSTPTKIGAATDWLSVSIGDAHMLATRG